jgi:hypothetical protein
MPSINELCVFWAVVAIQIVGVLSVAVARLTEDSCIRTIFHRTFFVCLLAVGLATIFAIRLQSANWLPCAATLGLMSVGATLDCGSYCRTKQTV